MQTTKINNDLSIIQNPDGLTFGTDAYLLSAFVKGGARLAGADLGSGTGVIPLLCLSKTRRRGFLPWRYRRAFARSSSKMPP